MKYIFTWLFSFFAVLLILPVGNVYAVGEFTADYDVEYTVSPAGKTIVTQHVTLTNLLTNLYAKQYSIVIDSQKIKNVIASDITGVIEPKVTVKDGKTEILLTFNQQVVGIGKKLEFTLRFDHDDVAQKNGNIWEINIPGVSPDPDLGTYRLSLQVPSSFGPLAYLTPLPADGGKYWTKDQLTSGGISAAYGSKQIFDVKLEYHIENTKVTPITTEIALPPDTPYQKVNIRTLDPKPLEVKQDADGNWLARYALSANQKLDIAANLAIGVWLKPRTDFVTEPITETDYLKGTKYWDVKHEKIQQFAKQISTPRDAYDYVVKTLEYDYSRINKDPVRQGSLLALTQPKTAICMEFTDTFIALARAAGIPAREVVGYAYTTNSRLRPLSLVADVLHAWPEYYDQETEQWIPIDPTWADTTGGVNYFDKLDFNHIVFAIHGLHDDYPYPAGSYRKVNQTTKDIDIQFGSEQLLVERTGGEGIKIDFDIAKTIPAGIPTRGSVNITNTQGVSLENSSVQIQGTPFSLYVTKDVKHIPPFGKVSVPITLEVNNYFTTGQGKITATVNDTVAQYYIDIRSILYIAAPFAGGAALLLFGLGAIIFRIYIWKPSKPQ